jgi:hypothetical protein
LKLVLLSKNYIVSPEIDWIWYVSLNTSLGAKTKAINSYTDNYNFISSFYDCIKTTEKSAQQLKFFSFNRMHFLIKANKTKLKLKPILANLDFLSKIKITLLYRDRIEIYILKMAIFCFDNNIRIGKSFYHRYINSNLNSVRKKMKYNHFLSKEIPMTSQNLFKLQHD